MNPVSPLFAVPALLLALATCWLIVRLAGDPPSLGRFSTIDGARGYLAFFVFLHHASIWYFFLRTGEWVVPQSRLFTQFGQGSVALFFMITGFLFYTKLLDSRERGVDWLRFFVGRVLRLVPLYLLAVTIMFTVVLTLSHGAIAKPAATMRGLIRWLSFTILGGPDLNNVAETWRILAGVTWSLPYEWFFYLSLPMIALSVRIVPPLAVLGIGLAGVAGAFVWHADPKHLLEFGGGIAAALLVRNGRVTSIATSPIGSPLVLSLLVAEFGFFSTAYGAAQILILSAAFVLVAGGANLFGVLTSRVSRTLGEMAYSIYLLHGILLFVAFRFVLSFKVARGLTPTEFWLVIFAGVPVLILVCFGTFRIIERPAMDCAGAMTTRIRKWTAIRSPSEALIKT